MLVHQVHLQVAQLRRAPQVVLAHEAVEIDRRRRAGIGLIVAHFRNPLHLQRELVQHAGRGLERRSLRQVHDYLEFGLVVERQHLEHHELHGDETDRDYDRAQYRSVKLVTPAARLIAAEEGTQRTLEQAAQHCAFVCFMHRRMRAE